jgi:hypothetical protein
MLYFIALFCSPLALLLAGRPISALFNLILYILAIVLVVTILLAHFGFLLWLAAFVHAVLAINSAHEDRRARWIANSMRRDT